MKPLILPLMMYGKLRNHWHEENKPVKKRVVVGEGIYKSGKKKGQKYPIYKWVVDTKKEKVITGFDGVFRSGKNKGEPKPVYETLEVPYKSTGFYPSENAIYFNLGGGKRLSPMAEEKLADWHRRAVKWQIENKWICQTVGTKVIAEMTFYFPDKKMRDTHNAKKLLMDSLENAIHENDMWIVDRTIDFMIDEKNPRIEINFRAGYELAEI